MPEEPLADRLGAHMPRPGSLVPHSYRPAAGTAVPVGAGGAAAASVAFLRETMVAATDSASELRRRIRQALAVTMAAILSLGAVVAVPAAAVVAGSGTLGGFEQDGNLVVDADGNLDWVNQPGVVKVIDDTLDSGFRGSSKEEDPENWVCQEDKGGVNPPKDNVLRAYVNPR
ncbi:MAG: hypothetical protein KY454_12035, partial [Actinobacteria bacterium]|nr:hypothetical protein [Actinomycetota bacterium]